MKINRIVFTAILASTLSGAATAQDGVSFDVLSAKPDMAAQMTAAKSPEEAARIFMREVSIGVTQAVADAIAKGVAGQKNALSTASSGSATIAGWEEYVSALQLQWVWPTPAMLPRTEHVAVISGQSAAASGSANPSAVTGSISIGVNIGF